MSTWEGLTPVRCINCGRPNFEHCESHGHACCPTAVCPGPDQPCLDDMHRLVHPQPKGILDREPREPEPEP